jgi:titin
MTSTRIGTAGTALFAVLLACLLVFAAAQSAASTSPSYPNVVFSDGFESGSLSAWNGYAGTGSGTVVAAAAHGGSSGLRLSNTSGQFGLVTKLLSAPLTDSSTSFWVRFGSGTGLRELAEGRDQASSGTMWAILYDGTQHGLWFYPFKGSSSTEIFTGANSVPANTWTKVEVQYTATAGGGAALYINGQTQAAWGVSGDYTRSTNFQRLQLWDDAADTSDFDDVTIATPPAVQTAPGAPTAVTGTAGNGSVALSWTAPSSTGGSPITSYRITPFIGATAQTPITTGNANTSFNVTGLTNGTAYTFTVAATNAIGTGPDSTASAAVTPVVQTAPGAPTAVTGTAGNASVALSWTAPGSNGGSAITSYRITPFIGATAQTPVTTGNANTSFTVTGLTNGTAYTFKVAATNAIGTGPDSTASAAFTPSATAPGAPTNVTGTAGNASVALSWTAPSSTGGSSITSYRITPSIGGTAQAPITTGNANTSFTVTGLTNGTAYTFTVAATNAIGTGPNSSPTSAITPAAGYANVIFSDGLESGSLSAWNGYAGTGSGTAVAAAAHSGSFGLRLSNTSGQFGLVTKVLSAPVADSSTSFWVRFGSGTGLRELAEARDQGSGSTMWALLYDGTQHGLWFYPFKSSSSTEIFTGANSVPANTWTKVEVRYTATAAGGAALFINGQTQAAWSTTGDYTRSTNFQRLQLWDDAADTTDFDDVTIATPGGSQTAPGAPTAVSGSAGDRSVALSWTAPASDGGSQITSYRITPFIGGTAQTPITTGSANTSFNVTGLTNGTAYTFTVAATNVVGTGPDSTASAAVTPTAAPTAPGAPTNVSGLPGDASVALSWTAPSSNGGSPITSYRITPYIGTTAQAPVATGSAATSFTVTGLTNGTAYTFKVAATNAVGTGPDSAASSVVTPRKPTAPGAPTALTGTPGDKSVDLSWTAPASDGGSPITSYRITPYVGTTAQTPIDTGTTSTQRTVTGLTNGTTYTFTVAATNAVGTGTASAASAPLTPKAAKTVVSIEFDDDIETQFQALQMLQAHGMHATFYVNSGLTTDDIGWRMSWPQLLQLSAAGNEIGGHSWDHADLTTLSTAQQQHEICDDRTNIQSHGLPLPTSFAYPYGAYEQNNVPAMVQQCGYTSGREVGGIRSALCDTCPFAETIPPANPMVTRTAPDVRIDTTLATVEGYVTQAEQNGGGWVQLVFHDLCATNCTGDDYSTTPALLEAFLDWLEPRAANGTVVKTVGQVMSGN